MKKIFTLIIIFPICLFSFSYSKEDIEIAINNLCKEIVFQEPYKFEQETYTELAYLKRNFNLTKLAINDSVYRSKIFNNYYYDQYYLYSKFLDENAVVTEDCIHGENTEFMYKGTKLLFYSIYPSSIKLPNNVIEQLEEYATADEFLGPYGMLTNIYYLKKYNYQNLSEVQKDKLAMLENHFSKLLYSKYIENKPWSFYRLLSVKVLKMNNNALVKDLDASFFIDYFKSNKPLYIMDADKNNKSLFNRMSFKYIIQSEATAILWLILLDFNKI